MACGAHLSLSHSDCLQAASLSFPLDAYTRWLLIAVKKEPPSPTGSALGAIHLDEERVTEARIASGLIVLLVGLTALLVGRLLAWAVTEPMLQLSSWALETIH